MGFAKFSSPNEVDAGTVNLNSINALTTTISGNLSYYNSFNQNNPQTLQNVNFQWFLSYMECFWKKWNI
jgi:hypothetical protein